MDIDRFRWYDQYAPIGRSERKIKYNEAGDFVVKHLSSFSRSLGDFAKMAIEERWIEAEDRPGKAQGGFCTGLDMNKQSRIFMTYSETFGELLTLAHELGHAYHSWVLKDKDYFATQYPMNLAETASIFNELLVIDAAYEETDDPAEKLRLLDQKLQQAHIFFCDIRCRYLFDSTFYEERKKGVVPKDRLSEIMTGAQRTAYAGTLSEDGFHKLFWATKLHFFITDMPFYNFPYTFGFLFAGGVYNRARQEGPAFADKYDDLLADTGSMRTEELAKKHLGVDLTRPDFWETAVKRTLDDVSRFVELSETVGAEV
jgi:oligoendopeptidase F